MTASGIAKAYNGVLEGYSVVSIKVPVGPWSAEDRLISNLDKIMAMAEEPRPDFVIIEDVAYAQNAAFAKENAGMAYAVRMELRRERIPFVVIGPSQLKKFATGSGGAKKELVIKEVMKRWGADCPDNNTADAVALAYLGMALVGEWTPTIQPQREAVDVILAKNSWLRKIVIPSKAVVNPISDETNPIEW